jgi:hypothetical protein
MFIKPDEPAKIRSIVVGDMTTYLLMSYLDEFFQPLLRGSRFFPLAYTDQQRHIFAVEFARWSEHGGGVAFPTDQSKFDHNVPRRMILFVLRWLGRAALSMSYSVRPAVSADVDRANGLLARRLRGGRMIVEQKGKVTEIAMLDGLPSGWRLTALLDSITNYLEDRSVSYAAEKSLHQLRVFEHYTMLASSQTWQEGVYFGDDVRKIVDSGWTAGLLFETYKAVGLDVNASKSWISAGGMDDSSDEFLRMVSKQGRAVGYPARLISGLMYRRPGSRAAPGLAVLQEEMDSWLRAISRGCRQDVIERLAVGSISRVLRVPAEEAARFLHTPSALGGYGWTPWTTRPLVWKVESGKELSGSVKQVNLPLLRELDIEVDEGQYLLSVLPHVVENPPARQRGSWSVPKIPIPRNSRRSYQPVSSTDWWPKPVRPIWAEQNKTKMSIMLTSNSVSTEEILQLATNRIDVEAALKHFGRHWWHQWLRGPLTPTPAVVVSVDLIRPLLARAEVKFFPVHRPVDVARARLQAESFVLSELSSWLEQDLVPYVGV